jgi:pyruvate dehydrogenase E2 component (dihydrolipoamide acetyltransferase)
MGKDLPIREIKIFDIHRRVVSHMTESAWKKIPHAVVQYDPDITDLFDEYIRLKNDFKQKYPNLLKLSFNTLILKIIGEGLKVAPELNALLDYNEKTKIGQVFIADRINIAIPWLLSDGRDITPVIPDVGNKNLKEILEYLEDLKRRVANSHIDEVLFQTGKQETLHELKNFKLGVVFRGIAGLIGKNKIIALKGEEKKKYYEIPEKDRLTSSDFFNASILVSNIGAAYPQHRGHFNLLEIIPPQVFVIGISAIQERPGVYIDKNGEKKIGIRKILPLTLTFDHRWLDYAPLIPFEKKLDEIFENPKVIYNF